MKKWYVYELINLMGTVEYVGESYRPDVRYNAHVKWLGGKFYGRGDIFMNIVKEFDKKTDAYHYQCLLQNQYGIESDRDKNAKNGKKYGYLGGVPGRNSTKRAIICYTKCKTKIIGEYDALIDAANDLDISVGNIHNVLSGRYNQTNGYYFQYK